MPTNAGNVVFSYYSLFPKSIQYYNQSDKFKKRVAFTPPLPTKPSPVILGALAQHNQNNNKKSNKKSILLLLGFFSDCGEILFNCGDIF